MLFARKNWSFTIFFLLALLKKLESESKSWSKIIQIGVSENSASSAGQGLKLISLVLHIINKLIIDI